MFIKKSIYPYSLTLKSKIRILLLCRSLSISQIHALLNSAATYTYIILSRSHDQTKQPFIISSKRPFIVPFLICQATQDETRCVLLLLASPGAASTAWNHVTNSRPIPTWNSIQSWVSMMNIKDVHGKFTGPFFSGQFGNIDPACCQAILSVQENCWHFLPTLKDSCSQSGGVASSAV
ncbi:uncharacterized protein LOC111284408 [Durio zibethinus]|uniref:Uncharacterized protein LOC111284408 n=1 Tax=Durio zibethinus TaxID=66656 RepID=A0A6P5XLQ1_DURZI|nr:uncharacterized protein LOC111284408 [Durio zibethinus]